MNQVKTVLTKEAYSIAGYGVSNDNSWTDVPEEFTGNSINEVFVNSPGQHSIEIQRVSASYSAKGPGKESDNWNTYERLKCSSACPTVETVASLRREVHEVNSRLQKLLYELTSKEMENQVLRLAFGPIENPQLNQTYKECPCSSNCAIL